MNNMYIATYSSTLDRMFEDFVYKYRRDSNQPVSSQKLLYDNGVGFYKIYNDMIKINLAGVDYNTVSVEVCGNELNVEFATDTGKRNLSINLDEDVDMQAISATLNKGVLVVNTPKVQPRKISIEVKN